MYNNVTNTCEKKNQETILLFDVDNTIGVSEYEKPGTTLRPCLISLLDMLQKKIFNIEIGLLSTRGKEFLEHQLEDPKELQPIKNYINKKLIFSTDELKDEEFYQFFKREEYADYLKNHPLITKELREEEMYSLMDGQNMGKLERLKQVHKNNSNSNIISVDDALFPAYLKNGVSLHEAGKGGFWI